ncbi:diacylglycerol kinase [Colwelliaceae bacterium 6441]
MSINHPPTQLGRLVPAIRHSLLGLKAAYQYEIAFRQYVWLSIVLVPLSGYLAVSVAEFAVLISGLFLILVAELLNTGIEAVVDRIGLEHHELSGRAKDLGSAAVFIAIVYFFVVWGYKIFTML